jgi:putative aldouronate transport system substrate-binding protein
MKKVTTLIISLVLVLALLVSCAPGSSDTDSQADATKAPEKTEQPKDTAPTEKPKEEPTKLTMMVQNHPAWPLKEDWLIWDIHNENANVILEVSGYQGNWWDAIPLIVASGDMPDLMWMVNQDAIKYGEQGAVENLLDHLDKMPNLSAFMAQYPDEAPPLYSASGKLYLHPAHGAFGEYDGMWLYRKDIFEKHQLELPNNYDEFYEVMKKLKEIYPESTPLYVTGLNTFNNLGINFGVSHVFFYDPVSKTVKYGPAEDNYKLLLEFIANAYKDNLIPIEFGNLSSEKLEQMLSTDKTFMYHGYESHIDKYNQMMREDNPDFTLAFMKPVEGPAGAYNARKFLLQEGLTVTTTSKNKEAALKYIDYLFTEEAREAVSWGKEGVTFEVVNGKKQFLPSIPNMATATIEFGIRSSGNMAWVDTDALQALKSEETAAAYEEGLKYLAPMSILPPLTKEEDDSISIKREAII